MSIPYPYFYPTPSLQTSLWEKARVWYVVDYGAKFDGVTDDTLAINLALADAAAAGGGVVVLPIGTCVTSNALIITTNTALVGQGFNTIIQPAANANFDVIATPIPASQGLAGFIQNYITIANLQINGTNMTGTTAGQGNGIHTYGTRYSLIDNVLIQNMPNWCILLDGDNTGAQNFGFDNTVRRSIFDVCAGGIFINNCEANDFYGNRFKFGKAACAAAQPAFGTQDTNTNHLRLNSGYCGVWGNVFGKGGTYNGPAIICSNSGPCRIFGNRFDQVRHQAVTMNAGNHEFVFNALGSPCSANSGDPAIQLGNSNNRVIGNSFDNTAGSTHHTFCVSEAGGPFSNNVIAENNFIQGTSGNGFVSLNATSTALVHHNGAWSSVGNLVAPTFPATTVGVTNNTGYDITAYVANGTGAITVIQVAGLAGTFVTTGLQIAASSWGTVRIPAGGQVKFTYASGAPTWTWFAD